MTSRCWLRSPRRPLSMKASKWLRRKRAKTRSVWRTSSMCEIQPWSVQRPVKCLACFDARSKRIRHIEPLECVLAKTADWHVTEMRGSQPSRPNEQTSAALRQIPKPNSRYSQQSTVFSMLVAARRFAGTSAGMSTCSLHSWSSCHHLVFFGTKIK